MVKTFSDLDSAVRGSALSRAIGSEGTHPGRGSFSSSLIPRSSNRLWMITRGKPLPPRYSIVAGTRYKQTDIFVVSSKSSSIQAPLGPEMTPRLLLLNNPTRTRGSPSELRDFQSLAKTWPDQMSFRRFSLRLLLMENSLSNPKPPSHPFEIRSAPLLGCSADRELNRKIRRGASSILSLTK